MAGRSEADRAEEHMKQGRVTIAFEIQKKVLSLEEKRVIEPDNMWVT